MTDKTAHRETAESMARKQRDISVSEFFLKNRHLLGFDSPRRALLTTVKEAVDNALDACEEAGILPEIAVDIRQTGEDRFVVSVTDNGPGIVRAQIPKIFAKLLYGSKFHRLRMSRGQQGIGISAAGMYGQLTTGAATRILSRTAAGKVAHHIEVHLDTSKNQPAIVKDVEVDWQPAFPAAPGAVDGAPVVSGHGTCVSIEMQAAYVRGRLSVDEYIKQCAVVNPHLQLHFRVTLQKGARKVAVENDEIVVARARAAAAPEADTPPDAATTPESGAGGDDAPWQTFARASTQLPPPSTEIKPHPHGVELGVLIQMLKNTSARTVRAALNQDFSRVSGNVALQLCEAAGLSPTARPAKLGHAEIEALFKAIAAAKLMRPPTDCLSPIGEEAILAGLRKEIAADFYTAVTRAPAVYRGNPFQIEVGLAYARPGSNPELNADESVRVMRFANRVPLLYMAGACSMSKALVGVNWKSYGLPQPRGALPVGPAAIMVHMASVWVPFTSESKEAVAAYPEIVREIAFALQECGRRLGVYLSRHRRQAELDRKRNYMALYIPHLALGIRSILELGDKEETRVQDQLHKMLERTHLETGGVGA